MLDYLCGYTAVFHPALLHAQVKELHLYLLMPCDVLSTLVAKAALVGFVGRRAFPYYLRICLLYTSDAADEL